VIEIYKIELSKIEGNGLVLVPLEGLWEMYHPFNIARVFWFLDFLTFLVQNLPYIHVHTGLAALEICGGVTK
jgi:hypothetical protein